MCNIYYVMIVLLSFHLILLCPRITLSPSPVSPKLRTTLHINNYNNSFIKPVLKPVPRTFSTKDDFKKANFGAKLFETKSPVPAPRLSDIFQMIRLGNSLKFIFDVHSIFLLFSKYPF